MAAPAMDESERLRYRDVDREGFMAGLERNGPKAIADFTRG